MRGDLGLDHLSLAIADHRHVDGNWAGGHAVLGGVVHEMRGLSGPDLVLARHAGDVGTGAADPFALHHGGSAPGLRHMPGDQLATRSTAENQNFILLRLGHGFLPV